MLVTRCVRLAVATLAAALLLVTAFAADGRNFAGFYSLSDASAHGDQVRVTVHLQLFNYSGADLDNAVVSIREAPGVAVYGAFAPVAQWRDGHDVILTHQFTVPRQEYDRWTAQSRPHLSIVFTDRSGEEWTHTAQINPVGEVPAQPTH